MQSTTGSIRCCTCGDAIQVDVKREPAFGFELYDIAKQAGWKPSVDLNFGRTLIFCSEECYKAQLTKRGYIRKNLLHKPKEETV